VATELRCSGCHNFTFTRHEFLVVTVKEWLKLVYFYQSNRKNKSGVPLILDHSVYSMQWVTSTRVDGVVRSRHCLLLYECF